MRNDIQKRSYGWSSFFFFAPSDGGYIFFVALWQTGEGRVSVLVENNQSADDARNPTGECQEEDDEHGAATSVEDSKGRKENSKEYTE